MRIGAVSGLSRRGAAGDHTHALLSGQSQSIRDNVMALFGAIRAWNCSAANLARTGRISAMWNRIPIERSLVRSASAIHSTADQGSVVTLVHFDLKETFAWRRGLLGSG